ncbi:Endonuclease/exonuclease/phosphatase [Elsinoe ampelina]|uniref:Endonuclease/exonuclease/phosphatase n=1 Tax=Elsinoe ampelina TaxID=302913 RepID=A0A6A6G4D1_9PEZI|nr:Endonuclease/exonuclease/phosphatase [Elsinoe ampelina]
MHYTVPTVLLSLPLLTFAQTSGSLSVLTFNVAGLPDVINDNAVPGDKTTNARTIGTKLAAAAYDVVHLQEDFNYHAALYSTLTYPYRTSTSGGVPFGSGLNTVANYPWTGLQRVKWDKCDLNSGDCLTPKGFTFMRMTVADGVEVDMYNLHADAGSNDGDASARAAGVQQILTFMGKNSAGRAVIIFGDTNDRYTNRAESVTTLLSSGGLKDPWVDIVKKGVRPVKGTTANACGNPAASLDCEIVDKVFYRSGAGVQLTARTFEYASRKFLQDNGSILSDHNPVLVNFDWKKV